MKIIAIILGMILLFVPATNYSYAEEKIPDWVRNIFLWYGQGQISEEELLNAIQYLINQKILVVQNTVQAQKFSDDGDFQLVFTPTRNPTYQQYEKLFNNYDTFVGFVGILNNQYSLPHDITINFKECGIENAYYNSVNRELVMCYELIGFLFNFYSQISESEIDLAGNLLSAVLFIFYHELGHALVDVYELPITGMEEDAVDQFSALTFIRLDDFGKLIIGSVSLMFLSQGLQKTKIEDLKFWDEHSLELQRFYNLVCWVYGSDPKGSSGLVQSGLLPKQRADRCPSEYEQINRSWDTLLSPHYKQNSIVN